MTIEEAQTWMEIRELMWELQKNVKKMEEAFNLVEPMDMLQEEKNTHLSNSDVF